MEQVFHISEVQKALDIAAYHCFRLGPCEVDWAADLGEAIVDARKLAWKIRSDLQRPETLPSGSTKTSRTPRP